MHSRWNEAEAQGYRKVREPLSLFPKSEGTDTNNLDFIVIRIPINPLSSATSGSWSRL